MKTDMAKGLATRKNTRRTWHKGRNLLIGRDGDIFGWLTLNNCSIISCRALWWKNIIERPNVEGVEESR